MMVLERERRGCGRRAGETTGSSRNGTCSGGGGAKKMDSPDPHLHVPPTSTSTTTYEWELELLTDEVVLLAGVALLGHNSSTIS